APLLSREDSFAIQAFDVGPGRNDFATETGVLPLVLNFARPVRLGMQGLGEPPAVLVRDLRKVVAKDRTTLHHKRFEATVVAVVCTHIVDNAIETKRPL